MRALFQKIKQQFLEGNDLVLVSVTASSGSTPRGAGSRMLVSKNGRVTGTIGGGAVEYRAECMALDILEKEKNISKDVMMEAIENSLLSACKNHFGTSDNIKIIMDRNTCDYSVYAEREVVEEVFDPAIEISLEDAEKIIRHFISEISHRLSFIPRNSDVLQHRMQRI